MRIAVLAALASISVSSAFAADSPVKIAELSCEHMANPVGVGFTQPRFSWKILSDRPGEVQTAYEIRAASSADKLAQADLWDSGKITSDQSVLVPWGAKALDSRATVYWQVKVWDKDGNATEFSAPSYLELGLLHPKTEWKGQWITADLPRYDIVGDALATANWITSGADQSQLVATRVVVNVPDGAKVSVADIDVAAEGLIALYVNGIATRQGPSSHTAPFHADFGHQLKPGKNIIALSSLGVRGRRGGGASTLKNALAAHGVIELEGGQKIDFISDSSWKAASAPDGEWYAGDFDDAKWTAATIEGPYSKTPPIRSADGDIGPGRYMRKTFATKGPIAKARLYATALGVYEASINGKPVSDNQLAPGWTDYWKRVMVQTYDVTNLLTAGGNNTVGAVLSDGWFAGRLGWMGPQQYARISDHPSFNAQLEITYADGSTETIATDPTWKGGPGEIVGSDEQLGEVLDGRKVSTWDQSSFDDSAWKAVTVEERPEELDTQLGPPVRRLMELTPKKITRMGDMWVVDFGQNMVGHVRLTANGPAGTKIQLLHGETVNPSDGTVYFENLRQAISLDTFILGGNGEETFEPHFTFHGFRYAQITGYPGELTADKIRGIVVGSDTPNTGTFECSNADVNQLASNIRWSQRGNFLSVPTDCPQRDERMGWMGDAQVFAPTATYNADVSTFYQKWMVDVNDGQVNGSYYQTSPRVDSQAPGYAIWSDAGTIIPWVSYTAYGDKKFLSDSYDHMALWVDYSKEHSANLLVSGGVGDNLAPLGGRGGTGRGGPGAPGAAGAATQPGARGARAGFGRGGGAGATTRGARGAFALGGGGGGRGGFGGTTNTTAVLDTAYFAHSAWIVAQSAAILGKTEDAAKYTQLFNDIKAAFAKAYIHDDGSMVAGTQSTYVVALEFGLVPDNLRAGVAQHLVDDINKNGHLGTGFVGVGFLNPALNDIGRTDLAYKLLLTDTYPSWLFPIKQGATTIWERWDGYTPERGFQASSMNSFNHYSLGAVGKWLYSGAAGIALDEEHPGFKQFNLQPEISTKLDYVKATLNSPYGIIASGWKIENGQVSYDATVPPNTSATLTLPAVADGLKESGAPAGAAKTVGTNSEITLAPGTYHFSFPVSVVK